MKLRNKKTGDIIESEYMMLVQITSTKGERNLLFENLTKLNEEWEDYNPKEPLIKDEKIRKAIRAWAEAEDIKGENIYYEGNGEFSFIHHASIGFSLYVDDHRFDGLRKRNYYNITELCGEEEECES